MARKRLTIRLPLECVEWLDRKVGDGVFSSRSQAIEVLILEAMKPTGRVSLTVDSEKTFKLHKQEH